MLMGWFMHSVDFGMPHCESLLSCGRLCKLTQLWRITIFSGKSTRLPLPRGDLRCRRQRPHHLQTWQTGHIASAGARPWLGFHGWGVRMPSEEQWVMIHAGWWLSQPLWKIYEFGNWDDDIPNIWKNEIHVPVTTNQYLITLDLSAFTSGSSNSYQIGAEHEVPKKKLREMEHVHPGLLKWRIFPVNKSPGER